MQFDRIGLEAQRPLEIGDRRLQLAKLLAYVAEVVERVDRSRGEGERPFKAPHGLGAVGRPEDVPQIMVKRRVPAVPRDRCANVLDRVAGAAALMLDQAEQMEGLRMSGVDRQDLPADALRLRRAAGALMGECGAERSGDRRRRAAGGSSLVARTGVRAPLLSVHRHLIAQPGDTYPRMRGKLPAGDAGRAAQQTERRKRWRRILRCRRDGGQSWPAACC